MKALFKVFKNGLIFRYKKFDLIDNPRLKKQVYLLKEGFIHVYEHIYNEKKSLIILEPGNVFPLTKTTKNSNVNILFEALTDVSLQAIDEKTFFDQAYGRIEILKNIIELLTNYLDNYLQRVETLEYNTIQRKLIARLIHFEKRFGKRYGTRKRIKIPITHEFIATSINVARENVSREITRLQKENIITLKYGKLTILNAKALKNKLTRKSRVI